jgi:hypothetical protein
VELPQQIGTLLEMLKRFPTVVLRPIPFPLDQVTHPEAENFLNIKILSLRLLGRGSHS